MNKSEIAEKAARYKAFTEQLERNVAEVKIGINDNSPLVDAILPENAEPKLDMRMDEDLEGVSPSANIPPTCHRCGNKTLMPAYKCSHCGAFTGVEEVSPPSPEQRCPKCGIGFDTNGDGDCVVCASPAYKQREGDTRELKAALTDSTLRLEQLIRYTDFHHDTAQIYRDRIAENKRLLG